MKMKYLVLAMSASALLYGCGGDSDNNNGNNNGDGGNPGNDSSLSFNEKQVSSEWYQQGEAVVAAAKEQQIVNEKGAAKNVILFVGDGMGISTVTAARILAGQMQGLDGEEYQLSFEKMPFSGLVKTYNTNQQTPDSAGTMTAMMSGVKTKAGVIGVAEEASRADCGSSQGKGLVTALELAEDMGKATGVLSTARITHATPAATYAKSPERNWESDDGLTDEAVANGCKDIADQLVSFDIGDGIDVVLGGGRRHFLPSESGGKRTDGRDLTAEWKDAHPTGSYVQTGSEFAALDAASVDQVLGLFTSSHMSYDADREANAKDEPSLTEMTSKSIDILSRDEDGYFLMVESGRIDHGHHAGSAYTALTDAVEFSNAIQAAMDKTSAEDTLIIVTADHSHVFTIAGYPTRGNPILGKVVTNDSSGEPESEPSLAADSMPYTTLGYTNGLGFADLGDVHDADARYGAASDTGRKDLAAVETQSPGYHQEALVPLGSETHAGEDVGVWARGPGAHLLTGTNEQSLIFHVMAHAGGLLPE
ncbi:MAG: alkaline phosphatase [Pseudomonadota bacterium]|uniref:alkaline phosphatase n=1 Tax=uncultured Alcanivorax sp. TaxID=191215 RepID=UPI002439E3FF|nr:alkaline phosphatase [Pseudomonadota bacterium]MEE3388372.1 alkaline phosphatase [Pseudomonadota bacterium]